MPTLELIIYSFAALAALTVAAAYVAVVVIWFNLVNVMRKHLDLEPMELDLGLALFIAGLLMGGTQLCLLQ